MSTIVYDPFAEEIPAFFDMDLETLIEQKHPTSWVEFERAAIDESTYFERFFEDGRRIDGEGLRRTVREAYEFVPAMERLLGRLAEAGYEMHAMSNYTRWYRMIEQELRLSRFLDWSFVSCETGYRKPNTEAYRHALDTLGADPEECLFVDDRRVNCRAAREVGIEAICFESAEALKNDILKGDA